MKRAFESIQIPPLDDDVLFENFITSLFNELEGTYSYARFGRSGQGQEGIDVYSVEKQTVIQCKLVTIDNNLSKNQKYLISELESDFNEFKLYNEKHGLPYRRFIFASTFRDDTKISTECAKLSSSQYTVEYWGWNRLKNNMRENTYSEYYHEFSKRLSDFYEPVFLDNNVFFKQKYIKKYTKLIDQLYFYFNNLYKEINIIPNHLFVNNPIFKTPKNDFSHYSSFTLYTDNLELFSFFESLVIDNNNNVKINNKHFTNGVKNYKNKIVYILTQLSNNLIFRVDYSKSRKPAYIRLINKSSSACVMSSYYKLKFRDLFDCLSIKPTTLEEQFHIAYIHYEIGNFIKAAECFEEIVTYCKINEHRIWYTIAKFNLSKLYVFIKINYLGGKTNVMLENLKSIDLEKVYNESRNRDNKQILHWIINTKFYTSHKDKIIRNVNKIKDNYYSQHNGGWSSDNYTYDLYSEFAELENFVTGNYIIFDQFLEYTEICDVFIEGLLYSHALNENHSGRLEFFDDWLIKVLIFKGKASNILKYYKRVGLKLIKYKQSDFNGDSFIDIVQNFFLQNEGISQKFSNTCEEDNRYFEDKYNSILSNLLLVASIFDLETSQIKLISRNLLSYLNQESLINFSSYEYVNLFIRDKGRYFDESDLNGFLMLQSNKEYFHDFKIMEAVLDQFIKSNNQILLAKDSLNQLLLFAFNQCEKCNNRHDPNFLAKLYYLTDSFADRLKIKTNIEKSLNENFDPYLYYISAIFDIFDTNDTYFSKFIDYTMPSSQNTTFRGALTGVKDNRFRGVNMLVNLCFKFDIDMSVALFDDFRKLNDYYLWLFDLQNFNYKTFNPKWAAEYNTKYYIRQFIKYPIILECILNYLKENSDSKLEQLVIDLVGNYSSENSH